MFWIALQFGKGARRRGIRSVDEPSLTSLDQVRAGQEVKVMQIAAGQSAMRRLAQFGIRSGTTIKVRRSAPMGGPILVESGGSTVAVGRGMARKVSVRIPR